MNILWKEEQMNLKSIEYFLAAAEEMNIKSGGTAVYQPAGAEQPPEAVRGGVRGSPV